MPTIKNREILLYNHFNKIIKGPGPGFQSSALGQKHVRNVYHTPHQYLTEFLFESTLGFKRNKLSIGLFKNKTKQGG